MLNVVTQLSQTMFGIEVLSPTNAYIVCIGLSTPSMTRVDSQECKMDWSNTFSRSMEGHKACHTSHITIVHNHQSPLKLPM